MRRSLGPLGAMLLVLMVLLVACAPVATPTAGPTKAAPPPTSAALAPTPTAAAPAAKPTEPAKAAAGPIKIGFLTPLVGVFAALGADLRDGFLLYLDEKGNTLAGRKVEVIVEDDEQKPDVGLTKAKKLVERDGVHMLGGIISSGVALSVGPYATAQKKVLLLMNAGADELTQQRADPFIFRNSFANSMNGMPAGDWAYKQKGWRTAVILGSDYAAGWETVGGFARTFTDLGGRIVQEIYPPLGNPDPAPFVTQIKQADVTFVFQAGADTARFVPAYTEYGVKARQPLAGGFGLADITMLPSMGDAAVGIFQSGPYFEDLDTEANRAFRKKFQDKFGRVATLNSEASYTAARMVARALETINGNIENTDAFIEAMRKVEVPDAPRGPVKFDKYQNVVGPFRVSEVQKKDGKLVHVAVAEYPNMSQFYKWSPEEWLKMPPLSEMKGKWVK